VVVAGLARRACGEAQRIDVAAAILATTRWSPCAYASGAFGMALPRGQDGWPLAE
jgi:hypothetical protein